MKLLSSAVGALMIVALGGAASAADLGAPGTSYKDGGYDAHAAKSWTGLYLGAGFGAGAAVHDLTADRWGVVDDEAFRERMLSLDGIGGEGVLGTVQIGGDYQFGHSPFVFGVFADYDLSGIKSDASAGDYDVSLKLKNTWSVGGRLGFLTTSDTLVYALAAYSRADGSIKATRDDEDIEGVERSPSFDGWTVGGGLETRLSGNWFLKGEYRFTQYDEVNVWSVGNSTAGMSADIEPSVHTARAVLAYRFPVGK